jgi:hypothetical protein
MTSAPQITGARYWLNGHGPALAAIESRPGECVKESTRRQLWGLFSFGVVALLQINSASAAADVTQARYMTPSQFLHSLKQVSLTLHVRGNPLNEYLSAAQAGDFIQNALANRGIVVRPNSPVTLEVTLSHDRRSTKDPDEPIVRHEYFLTLQFFVRGAV